MMKRIAVLLVIGAGVAAVLWGATSLTTAGDIVMGGRVMRGTAEPPCFDTVNRYVDCGNGTVTDTVTGLIWLADAVCATLPGLGGFAFGTYQTANEAAAQLRDGMCGLSDGSRPGDWRLATIVEWEETIAQAVALSCVEGNMKPPSWTDDAGTGCWIDGGATSFSGVQSSPYWSSSSSATSPTGAWNASLNSGSTAGLSNKTSNGVVWPVRGGQ